MDIWDWVIRLENDLEEAGQEHASRIIDQITTEILDLNIGKADALIPEAIALSRSLKNPWLEVFFRHWEMRNRIGNKSEGEIALHDVVELFEFAHRDETITCPQTVCVTQDLSACYANIDGPGWVEERKAVCNETFERINPKWNCFHCLSCEFADALLDENKPQEALSFLKTQSEKIIEAGEDVSEAIHTFEIQALLRLNQPAQALAIIEKCEAEIDGYDWPVNSQDRNILKAQTLATLGRLEEAWDILPIWQQVVPRYYLGWIRAIDTIITKLPEKNTWQLGSALQNAIDHFVEVGSHRKIIETAEIHIRLALARNSIWTAKRALTIAEETLPKLRAPLGADHLISEWSTKIKTISADVRLPVPADQLLEWLDNQAKQNETEGRNPEKEIELLILAVNNSPNNEQLVDVTSSALYVCHANKEAEALQWSYIENNHQQESNIAYQLLNKLLTNNQLDKIDRLANYYQQTAPQVTLWANAQKAFAKEEFNTVKTLCLEMHQLVPDYLGPIKLMVATAVTQQDFAEAAKWQQVLVEKMTENPRNELWDLLSYNCATENWLAAREVAKRLEISLTSTEGVIEENWGWSYIRVFENNEWLTYLARLTGPVTAVIKEPARPSKAQRMGDLVVLDAELLEPIPEDEEERKYFVPTYRVIKTLKQGGFGESWFIDGVYPSEETMSALEQLITSKGWRLWIHSNENYKVTDQFDSDETQRRGVFFSITAPDNVPPMEIDQLLTKVTDDWEYPVHWLRLAEAVGKPIEPHQEIISRYEL